MKRWLSRNVYINGQHNGVSIVTQYEDGTIETEKFHAEKPGVSYTDKIIDIRTHNNRQATLQFIDKIEKPVIE